MQAGLRQVAERIIILIYDILSLLRGVKIRSRGSYTIRLRATSPLTLEFGKQLISKLLRTDTLIINETYRFI